MTSFLLFLGLFASRACAAYHELPNGVKRCKINDQAIDVCLQKAVSEAFRLFKDGVPSLGIPALEPLAVPELIIEDGHSNRPVQLNLHFKNLLIYGITDIVLSNYSAKDFKNRRLVSDAYSTNLWFESDYTSKGKVLVLPLQGSGRCNVSMLNVVTRTEVVFKPKKIGQETFWKVQQFDVNFKPKRVTMYFENLINSKEKGVNDGLNSFLNQNWQLMFEELRPSVEGAFSQIFKEITHRLFSKVPINKIFIMS